MFGSIKNDGETKNDQKYFRFDQKKNVLEKKKKKKKTH